MRTVVKVFALLCASTAVLAGEGRIPVYAPGTLITSPGKYVLTRNLNGTGAPVIRIDAQNVDLDLNGFYIDGALGTGIEVINANEVRIHNGVIQTVDFGINFSGSTFRATIEDLRIHYIFSGGIRLFATNNYAIRRVQIESTGTNAHGIKIENSGVGRIESCQFHSGAGRAISVFGGNPVAVVDNVISGFSGEGIYLDLCNGCLVTGNAVTQTGGQGGIYINSGSGVKVADNTAARNTLHGIHVSAGSEVVVVQGNVVRTNGSDASPGDGIRFGGFGGSVTGNTTDNNFGIGLHFLPSSSNVTFGRNSSRNNGGLGGGTCTGTPALFFPNSCNEGGSGNTTFGDNLIPGPPLF